MSQCVPPVPGTRLVRLVLGGNQGGGSILEILFLTPHHWVYMGLINTSVSTPAFWPAARPVCRSWPQIPSLTPPIEELSKVVNHHACIDVLQDRVIMHDFMSSDIYQNNNSFLLEKVASTGIVVISLQPEHVLAKPLQIEWHFPEKIWPRSSGGSMSANLERRQWSFHG